MITRSAGAIIFTQHHFPKRLSGQKQYTKNGAGFRKEKGKIYYLLLNYSAIGKLSKTYWGFSKGTIEQGEKEIDTIKREVAEETGIKDLDFIEGFKETEKYFFKHGRETIFKTVYFLLAETKTEEVKLSFEHLDFKWLTYEEAIKQLTFKNAKEILQKANDFLQTF